MAVRTAAEMVRGAQQQIDSLSPAEVREQMEKDDFTLIDIRDKDELEKNGRIPGSVHASRGMLEFYADPTSSYHRPEFNKNSRLILHCDSGGRSALAAATLKQMGYDKVAEMEGGIKAWQEEGFPVIP